VKYRYSIGDLVQVNFLVDSEDEKDTQAIYGIVMETCSEWRRLLEADGAGELDNEPHYNVKLTHSPASDLHKDWHKGRWIRERQIELKASP